MTADHAKAEAAKLLPPHSCYTKSVTEENAIRDRIAAALLAAEQRGHEKGMRESAAHVREIKAAGLARTFMSKKRRQEDADNCEQIAKSIEGLESQ